MTGFKTKIFKRMDTERTALKTGDLDSVNKLHRDQCLVSCGDEIQSKGAGGIYVGSSASRRGTTGGSGGHGTMEFMSLIGDDASCTTRIDMEESKVGGVIISMRSKASN
jgi:hypothetical protein